MIVPKIDQCGMKEKRAFEKRKNPGKKSLNEGTQIRLRKGPFIYYVSTVSTKRVGRFFRK